MKFEPEIGKRYWFRKKRYRVVEAPGAECDGCDAFCVLGLCGNVLCASQQRKDKKNINLVLQPKYRKEEKA